MIGFGTFTVIEQLSVCLWFGTLCVNAKINHLTIAVGIDIPEKDFKRAPPLFSIHCVFLMIAGLMYAFLRHIKQKTKRKIVPTSIEAPNVNITNRSTLPSQNNTSIFSDLTASMTKSASVPLLKVTKPPPHKLYLVQEANKDAINTTKNSNQFVEPIIINPNNLRLDAINDTETNNQFEEPIIINPNNLGLDENPKDPDHLGKEFVEINILVENNPPERMKAETDKVKTGFSICASVLLATLCIFITLICSQSSAYEYSSCYSSLSHFISVVI
jgi:hypothetical protein